MHVWLSEAEKFSGNTVNLHGGNCAYKWPEEQSGYPVSNMRSYC